MTLVSEAKIRARRTHSAPTRKATHDQLVRPPMTMTGTPASTAMPNAPPRVPPMKAAVLKNSALTTLTSRTKPDDWRVKRVFPLKPMLPRTPPETAQAGSGGSTVLAF